MPWLDSTGFVVLRTWYWFVSGGCVNIQRTIYGMLKTQLAVRGGSWVLMCMHARYTYFLFGVI